MVRSARSLLSPGLRRSARRSADALLGRSLGSINSTTAFNDVAMTFDDGPDAEMTPRLLELLDRLGVRSTFFLLVNQCDAYPELARAIADHGHEVALHGRDHRRITGFSTTRAATDYLKAARDDLAGVTNQAIRFYRPPYGSQSIRSFRAAIAAGLEVAVWNADVEDWVDRSANDVAAIARDRIRPGGVLLFHERLEPDLPRAAPTTTFDRCAVVEQMVEDCRSRGLEPATLGEMVRDGRAVKTAWFRA
jgi:peptidoglycan/xylan/chitin deacetylase (PgdA/CDA1 family)